MRTPKGMVQVAGTTYRVVRVAPKHYEAIRILDDTRVGSFITGKVIEVRADGIEPELMREIARAAIQYAKTSWVGRLQVS
jgi:hypothetical protein